MPCTECGRQPGEGDACAHCGFVPTSISERERAKAAVQAALRTLAEARAKAKNVKETGANEADDDSEVGYDVG